MKTTNYNNAKADSLGFWQDLFVILLSYLKTFLGAAFFASIFFFLYAGIKTGNIPPDITALSLSAIVTLILLFVTLLHSLNEQYTKRKLEIAKIQLELEKLKLEHGLHEDEKYQQGKNKAKNEVILKEIEMDSAKLLVRLVKPTVMLRFLASEILINIMSHGELTRAIRHKEDLEDLIEKDKHQKLLNKIVMLQPPFRAVRFLVLKLHGFN